MIARADIVVFVLDAESGIVMQDKKIGGKIVEEAKACIVVVNKWDLVEESVLEARKKEIERRDKHQKHEGPAPAVEARMVRAGTKMIVVFTVHNLPMELAQRLASASSGRS